MKTILVSLLLLVACFRAAAQVSVDLTLDQDQFLPNEAVRLTVKITNRSGQPMHLGAVPDWLTFSVESDDSSVVIKNGEVPVVEPFELSSSQQAIKRVDLQPYFQMNRPGRYRVTASMRIKDWSLTVNSDPLHFDVISGVEIWSQNFGMVMATNSPPESRRFTLIKASYLHDQLRLYEQLGSGDGSQVFRVAPLGPLVSFNFPEEQIDPTNCLHVLWQTGAQTFSYAVVGTDGIVVQREIYDNHNSRPRLVVTSEGDVLVMGGSRRPKPEELPTLKMPDAVWGPQAAAPAKPQ
jgi:hypothetical protein